MSVDTNSIAILNIHSVHYQYIISSINKNEAVNSLKNADLSEKSGT